LKTEYLKNPVGIDVSEPRFSWKLKSNRTGVKQNSYRISAWSDDRLIWDSGIIASGMSQRIRYAGDTLCSRQIVLWQVEVVVQDETGTYETAVSETALFEMGLLSKSDWICKWIEPELEVDPEQRKPSPICGKYLQSNRISNLPAFIRRLMGYMNSGLMVKEELRINSNLG
jgi:alpha-L-rhamnosidase